MERHVCNDQMNDFGEIVNLLSETAQDVMIEKDYRALLSFSESRCMMESNRKKSFNI